MTTEQPGVTKYDRHTILAGDREGYLKINGRPISVTLLECQKCGAAVVDTDESLQRHANWHGRLALHMIV